MAKIGLKQLDNILSGSLQVSGSAGVTGSISTTGTGSFGTVIATSFSGDGSQLTGITSVTTSSIENLNAGIISGSEQLPSGIISGSSQLPSGIISGSSQLPSGIISGSSQLPSGIVSGSAQITSILPSGVVSGSSQIITISDNAPSSAVQGDLWWKSNDGNLYVYYDGYWVISIDTTTVLPDGVISGSAQLPTGIISGSSQLPSGIISGSSQLPSGIISGSTHLFTAVTSSGDISGSGTGSFGVINVGGGLFTSASLAAGGAGSTSYNGNRRILQTGFPTLFSASFNPGTDGTISDFLDAVFYPNTAPSVSGSAFDVNEFEVSSSVIGTITATDAEALSSEISFSTQSGYSDDFFKIHSGSGEITLNTMSTASMNTVARPQDSLSSHPFLVQVSDTITTSNATIHIRVIPNTAPKFRTSGIGGSVITANTGSVNENTTNGTTVLTMFVTDDESDTITLTPLSQSANNHFSSSFTDVVGGKQLLIKTNTGSFDFESITSYNLAISASDQHFGSTPSSSGFITTMPILVNVTNNQAPTMASQVFSVNEKVVFLILDWVEVVIVSQRLEQ